MRRISWLLALGTVVTSIGCSSVEVSTDFDPTADFGALKSYAWLPKPQKESGNPQIDDNQVMHTRITNAVEKQLAVRGFGSGPSDTPDFLVRYNVSLRRKMSSDNTDPSLGVIGPGWGFDEHRYGGGWGSTSGWNPRAPSEAFASDYQEGALVLDIVNPVNRKLIWRGMANANVYASDSSGEREERINEAVTKMLAKFPPYR